METWGMKGNVCGMTHKLSMKLFKTFFFLRNQKERERGDKEFKTKCFSAHTEMQAPLDGFFPLE